MIKLQRSTQRQLMLLIGVRNFRRAVNSSSITLKQQQFHNHGAAQHSRDISDGFTQLGLMQPLLDGISAQGLQTPTSVQSTVIPRLIAGENLVLSASTGSGKTLAYVLPVIHNLLALEKAGYKRLHNRPRCLVLVPTRELASQVLNEVKQLGHYAKVSSCSVLGGGGYSAQKKALSGRVDVVVASPGRLVQHEKQGSLGLQEVSHIVIDEVDTMLTQGFGEDIRYVLKNIFQARQAMSRTLPYSTASSAPAASTAAAAPQLIMASATMTKAVRALLQDVDGFSTDFSDSKPSSPLTKAQQQVKLHNTSASRVTMNIAEICGVHHSLPHVTHRMVDTRGNDKLVVLDNIIQEMRNKVNKTMIFCNTIDSCRAVAYFLDAQSSNKPCLSYHGDIKSQDRARNLNEFRNSGRGDSATFMVCSDIAARGLDIPGVDHVVMFDFPLNPIDYLHRAGRTGRLGQGEVEGAVSGRVTAIVAKRDRVLAHAIDGAIARNRPLDSLTSNKKDYRDKGRLAGVVGKRDQKDYQYSREMDRERRKEGSRLTLKRHSNKRLVSDPNRAGIHVKQPAQKTVSRTVFKRIAEINQKRGDAIVRKRKKDSTSSEKKRQH